MKAALRPIALFVACAVALGILAVLFGAVPIRASSEHWAVTRWLLHFAMQRAVATRSLGKEVPALDDERLVLLGAGHYEGGCRPCHGAPGQRMPRIPAGMTPHPPPLPHSVRHFDAAELFFVVKHGIKFTGMPAWPSRERSDEVWAVVAFLRRLPQLDAREYALLTRGEETPTLPGSPGDAVLGLAQRHCARCHGSDGQGRDRGAFPRLAGQKEPYLRSSLLAYATTERASGIMQPIAAQLSRVEMAQLARFYASRARTASTELSDDEMRPGLPRPPSDSAALRGGRIAREGIRDRRIPSCASCHGPDAHPHYPRLDDQYAEYLAQQLRLFASGVRGGTAYANIMQSTHVHALTEAEIAAVAQYYAQRPPPAP